MSALFELVLRGTGMLALGLAVGSLLLAILGFAGFCVVGALFILRGSNVKVGT